MHIGAPADEVFDLVSDITRIGEFSPETFEAEWLDGASGPRTAPASAATSSAMAEVRCTGRLAGSLTCEPGREFAFAVMGPGGTTLNTWRYRLDPAADGTDVTESFELACVPAIRLYWVLAGWSRGRTNLAGMRTTLERIKALAESGTESGTGRLMTPPSGTSALTRPLRFGLVGTGYWARITHARALATTPGIELSAVWGRNLAAAQALAGEHGATVHADIDEFLADVDAVAFSVPPDVQNSIAIRAAGPASTCCWRSRLPPAWRRRSRWQRRSPRRKSQPSFSSPPGSSPTCAHGWPR